MKTAKALGLTIPPSLLQRARAGKTGSREADSLSAAWSDSRRYGRLTLVLSPLFEMVNVPDVVLE